MHRESNFGDLLPASEFTQRALVVISDLLGKSTVITDFLIHFSRCLAKAVISVVRELPQFNPMIVNQASEVSAVVCLSLFILSSMLFEASSGDDSLFIFRE